MNDPAMLLRRAVLAVCLGTYVAVLVAVAVAGGAG
jgi:hypothetical protein